MGLRDLDGHFYAHADHLRPIGAVVVARFWHRAGTVAIWVKSGNYGTPDGRFGGKMAEKTTDIGVRHPCEQDFRVCRRTVPPDPVPEATGGLIPGRKRLLVADEGRSRPGRRPPVGEALTDPVISGGQ